MSECSICGQELSSSPLAGPAHARKHKCTYIDEVGERPSTYDEVREWFAAHEDAQTSLFDY
jgi:predicted restriction endonuclease